MDPRPAPDPAKLLQYWMEWESGDTPPGRTLSNLKTHGLRELLEALVRRTLTTSAVFSTALASQTVVTPAARPAAT